MPTYGAIRAVDGVTSMVLDTAGGTREALQARSVKLSQQFTSSACIGASCEQEHSRRFT